MTCPHNHDQILAFPRKIFLKGFQIYQNYLCARFNAKYENFGSLACNQLHMFSGTYCNKKKREREKKSHAINYYGKSGDSRTPGPRQGLYTRNCNWRNYSFYHSWRPSWMPLFAENSRAFCPCTPPGALRRPLDTTCMRRIACFRHTRTIGLLAIIYNSFFSSFWSVCKTFFRRKSTQILARSLRSLDIIFLKFLVF